MKSAYCNTCKSRRYRQRNELKACYDALRNNSIRRGKEFTLTLEQFRAFCYKTKYLAGRGRKKDSYTIDRIDNEKGYTLENIRVLTNSENSAKGTKLLVYDYETKYARVILNQRL